MKQVKVGLIGCGVISGIYLENAKKFDFYEITACADLNIQRAKETAEKHGISKAYSPEELIQDPDIDLVLNLTIPAAHADIAVQALKAGKHVYSEKPLAVTRKEAESIMAAAAETGLLVGNAPDTFLGGGLQTSRKLIDDGWIGRPVSAAAFMMNHGHEHWHPDPGFYYQKGGGPMFDMGPYYITALISLMGPVKRVTGSASITFDERTVLSEPKFGEKIQVDTPTQINGVMDFHNGATASIITSFDTWYHRLPCIEVYGTEGSLVVPDPNTFGGPVLVRRKGQDNWSEIPLTHGFAENSRGIGLSDMAHAIFNGQTPRAGGDLAYHVLDIMHGFHDSSDQGKHYMVNSTCSQPAPFPTGINEENFTELISKR
ncbi:Gfo/Idh/MocA family protein [Domibacillus enclensis]|uniref:Oxidoreductase n=1 Tax=Domibacillus enclensis TaxID=1017273 RepID=A0A1N7BQL4_9BACI|nr:Gfo/Idh/MocA family oxidoreductase [Domibacillus enclensis]OXS74511.1 oxidoreductase [Domibacillus enclensis]SIR53628.1 Predicted dehydrogenase [Domibacillus enclensis]